MVHKTALRLKEAGGPTHMGTDFLKDILCTRKFGTISSQFCQTIADLAKRVCTETIDRGNFAMLNTCRLIQLKKVSVPAKVEVRPIGIWEILRRLVGKLVIKIAGDDIIYASGLLQTCAGVKSGVKAAAVHVMKHICDDDQTEVILLVDAENAFNNLNRFYFL